MKDILKSILVGLFLMDVFQHLRHHKPRKKNGLYIYNDVLVNAIMPILAIFSEKNVVVYRALVT